MPRVISALTARTQLGQILRRASQEDERFVVDRRGEPQVVIMGVKDFVRTIAPAPGFVKAIREAARRKGLNRLSMRQIDLEIAAARRQPKKS